MLLASVTGWSARELEGMAGHEFDAYFRAAKRTELITTKQDHG